MNYQFPWKENEDEQDKKNHVPRCKWWLIINKGLEATVNDKKPEIYFTLEDHQRFCDNECKKTNECKKEHQDAIKKILESKIPKKTEKFELN